MPGKHGNGLVSDMFKNIDILTFLCENTLQGKKI